MAACARAWLAGFLKRFQAEFKNIFWQVLVIAHELGLARMGQVAVDGTKIHANASKHSALSYGYAEKLDERLKRQVDELTALAEKADNKDRSEHIDYPAEIARRQDRREGIARAKAVIESRAAERDALAKAAHQTQLAKRAAQEAKYGKKHGGKPPKEPPTGPRASDQVNLTDAESRIMPVAGGGFEQAYNAQVAVDTVSMLVMATTLTQATNDKEQVVPMLAALAQAPKVLGTVAVFIADTGYCSAANVDACLAAGVEPVIAQQREKHHPESATERFEEPAALPEGATPVQEMGRKAKTVAGRADGLRLAQANRRARVRHHQVRHELSAVLHVPLIAAPMSHSLV